MKEKNDINKAPRIVYYSDELNDEFSTAKITPRRIASDYRYKRDGTFFGRLACAFFYRIVATPIAFLYLKIKFRHKIVGKEKLKSQGGGAFVYGNHTQAVADALIPTFVSFPRRAFVIVHANNVSMPVLGRFTPYMGALPLPDDLGAARNFNRTVRDRIEEGHPVFIYPEAHIWPYFTGIRSFPSDSFSYPIRLGVPVFSFTNTYQKRGKRSVRIVTYVDGPFLPDSSLLGASQRDDLRNRVYDKMKQRSLLSDAVLVEYRPVEDEKKE